MKLLNPIIDRLQAKFPPARATLAILAILTPIVAAGAAVATPWLATHFPGLPQFTTGQLTAFALGGIGSVLSIAVPLGYKYIDGWQKKEERDEGHEHRIELALIEAGHIPNRAHETLYGPDSIGAPKEVAQ